MRKTLAVAAATAITATGLLAPSAGAAGALTAKMSGAQEVPDRGDRNGRGTAVIRLDARRGRVCFNLTMRRIDGSAAAHIHRGKRGKAGDVVVALYGTPSKARKRRGCVRNIDAQLIREIMRRPGAFYVNVHNADFPDGAIRGQLRK